MAPAVDELWLKAHVAHLGESLALPEQHFLGLPRGDGKSEPTLEQVAALLRVGNALMRKTLTVAKPPA